MSARVEPDLVGMDDTPHIEITAVRRWLYRVVIRHGIMVCGAYGGYGWHVYGRRRAEAKGRRELLRYLVRSDPETWTVTL